MDSIWWFALFLLVSAQLQAFATSGGHGNLSAPIECLSDHASALLRLKQSFTFDYAITNLSSWEKSTDCCSWEGVGCNSATGHVNVLNLTRRGLYSYGIDQALFNLTSIQLLDLSMNDFGGSELPAAGFEKLSSLTYLDLSSSGFSGQIPISISKLTSLVSLDLSNQYVYNKDGILRNHLLLWEPNFRTLVKNFSKLRELHLSGVNISISGEEWCNALAEFVPNLQVIALDSCGLYGSFHQSFSSLHSLEVINLRLNTMSGVFPQYFANFLNLSVLMLAGSDLHGTFPEKIFELKHLTYLELSGNTNLMVQIQRFSNGSSLEALSLDGSNFSIADPSSFGNLKSLQTLYLDTIVISKKLSFSLSTLDSLEQLSISQFVILNESFFSWIGDLENLIFLQFKLGDFSKTTNSWIGNLTNLEELIILNSFFSAPIPPAIGNLKNLGILALQNCSLSGRIPSWIVELKELFYVDLSYNNLGGEIPTQLFALPKLQKLALINNQLGGSLPEFTASTSGLAFLQLRENKLSGHIPRSFWQLQSLNVLDLSFNSFSGIVELNTLSRLRKLSALSLSHNNLSVTDGEINNSLSPILPKLSQLSLSSCKLSKVPRSLVHLKHIQILDLSSNKIEGTVPEWLWTTWSHSLTYMNLSHNKFSTLELSSRLLPNKYVSKKTP
ncbi:unnamed protein product [Urochloa humidicola]